MGNRNLEVRLIVGSRGRGGAVVQRENARLPGTRVSSTNCATPKNAFVSRFQLQSDHAHFSNALLTKILTRITRVVDTRSSFPFLLDFYSLALPSFSRYSLFDSVVRSAFLPIRATGDRLRNVARIASYATRSLAPRGPTTKSNDKRRQLCHAATPLRRGQQDSCVY